MKRSIPQDEATSQLIGLRKLSRANPTGIITLEKNIILQKTENTTRAEWNYNFYGGLIWNFGHNSFS